MEVLGGIVAAFVIMALLAAVGLTTVVAFGLMSFLGLVTEMSFKRLFFVSFGVGLLAPILLGAGVLTAVEDGSLERDLRDEIGDVISLPDDMGENWSEALPQLQELSREQELGELTDAEAEARLKEIFSDFEDLQINIDVNGDGVVIGEGENGVPLNLPEPSEAESDPSR